MITKESKRKLPRRNGDRALAKIVGNAVTAAAAQLAPAEQPPAPGPWALSDAVTVGIQGKDGFHAMDSLIVLPIPGEYRRRFAVLGERMFRETVIALRVIVLCRMRERFPDCPLTVEVVQPNGDLCVSVNDVENGAYEDPHLFQWWLDDACARFAGCLGV